MKHLTQEEEIKRGELIAETLNLKKNKNGNYRTAWGTKSTLGLYRVMKRIIEEGK